MGARWCCPAVDEFKGFAARELVELEEAMAQAEVGGGWSEG